MGLAPGCLKTLYMLGWEPHGKELVAVRLWGLAGHMCVPTKQQLSAQAHHGATRV